MRRAVRALLAMTFVSLACAHAKTTDAARPGSEPSSATDGARASSARPAREPGAKPPRDPRALPIAAAAGDLMQPGAEERIRAKLRAGGFLSGEEGADAPIEPALRRFQRARDLPATGIPDNETVRKLGLDPNGIFRRAQGR